MSRFRKRMSRRAGRRVFRKGARVHRKNRGRMSRGGTRL